MGEAGGEVLRGDSRIDHRAALEAAELVAQVEACRKFRDAAHAGDPAIGDQHQRVGEAGDFLYGVAHVDNGHAHFVAQPLDVVQDLAFACGIERSQRFVHQQQPGAREQGAADRDTLLLTAGQVARPAFQQRAEVEQADHAVEVDIAVRHRGEEAAVGEVAAH